VSGDNEIRVSLSRDLTLFDITMIGIAGMIGAGIFALTGIATGIAGPAVLLAFLLNGIVATFTGLAYAELGSAIPEAGGSYLWVKEGIGNHFGFLAGWVDWAAHTIACSLYAVTFGAFFSEFVIHFLGYEEISQATLMTVSAFGIVTLMAYLNYLGAKESGRIGGFVTLFKVAILVVFAGFGIYRTFLTPAWSASCLMGLVVFLLQWD
jgi:amino acid transporter